MSLIELETLRQEAAGRSEDEFFALHPVPGLVIRSLRKPVQEDASETQTIRMARRPDHEWLSKTSTLSAREGQELSRGTVKVAFVQKKASLHSPFPNMITLGRLAKNDIQLALGSVSKVHAVILRGAEGEWYLKDQRSANGTWLDQERISPEDKPRLSDGAFVGVGPEVILEFLLPASLYAFLRRPAHLLGPHFAP